MKKLLGKYFEFYINLKPLRGRIFPHQLTKIDKNFINKKNPPITNNKKQLLTTKKQLIIIKK